MKVFQIGFNKCATKSLYSFFVQNGYNSSHWDLYFYNGENVKKQKILDKYLYENHTQGKTPLDGFDDYLFFSDSLFIQRHFELLDGLYPGSKFILNKRPIKDWVKSRLNHGHGVTSKRYMESFNITNYNHLINFWTTEWKIHEYTVLQYFQGEKKKQLLVFDIMKDGGTTLADFLPELKFKNLNFSHLR